MAYENHICEQRSKELYEGRSSQSAAPVSRRSTVRIPYKLEFFFFRLSFCNCIHNCSDLPSYNSSLRSSHIWFSFIHNFIILLSLVYNESIGHFRVPRTFTFKTRPSAQTFLWKWVLFAWEWKIISISKAEHLTSFWCRGAGKLGNGLFSDLLPVGLLAYCRALHRYRRGQGFESRRRLNFFHAFFSQTQKLRT